MSWNAEQRVYAAHVAALVRPGGSAPVHDVHKVDPGDLGDWKDDALLTLIAEGRRQHDRSHDDLERVRARAQVALALALALLAALGSLVGAVDSAGSVIGWVLWVMAIATGGWAALGAAASATVSADMETIDAALLSRRTPPLERQLAGDYAALARTNFSAVAVRLTNLRIAVTWLLIAATLGLGTWLIAQFDDSDQPERPAKTSLGRSSSTSQSSAGSVSAAPGTRHGNCSKDRRGIVRANPGLVLAEADDRAAEQFHWIANDVVAPVHTQIAPTVVRC